MRFIKRIRNLMALSLIDVPGEPDKKKAFVEGIQRRAEERKMAQIVEPDPIITEDEEL